jgi:D-glycero-alpha-D-manno-heptose 1-phosphate guanylyltransferase
VKLIVLAGGFGTRMTTVLPDIPKALAPVGGVPFLRLQLQHWLNQGVRSFVFLLHHQADLIIRFLDSESRALPGDCDVRCIREMTPLGTGGAVAHAVRNLRIDGTFLLTNADTWLGHGMRELQRALAPAIGVIEMDDTSRYGSVVLGAEDVVVRFSEKRLGANPGWINSGLCHLDAELFMNWDGSAYSLEHGVFPQLVSAGRLKAVRLRTDFTDIGVPEDYRSFCQKVEATRKGARWN